ncbi:DegT/DnrJ/EryC1/StrS family aminotransferase [Natronoflexus pectinivorans]|uniref:dTDP-4-amino-4,6-dideoxygalactose transaminase n=1 Tax=Natronoflexus pectinivorans TaxID=682526 RepID=A0A4V2RWH3_9BACT|nr:DegT/DnrJ/EryC1/StrS family aminotransferase [Natronoflexus pectinivorans]TCO08416.1 dTDP-4-amino-4,6-dideoxygalactose transaminase [Natronoflexus pectinivorans]
MSKIEMVDLRSQYHKYKGEIDAAVMQAMDDCQYIGGPEVGQFAINLADYLSVEHVIPCANGTDALQLALMALDLSPGDEVITSPFTFVATAEVIALLGLKPVFVDVEIGTYNIDVSKIAEAITEKTKVILPVHLFGQAASMEAIMNLADEHGLYVVEDVAQSLGAEVDFKGENRQAGTVGHIGCTSFFPSKNLGCFGDGGACFTNNAGLAAKMKMIASHGSRERYFYDITGINSRLDTLQAAILKVKLPYLKDFIRTRQNVAGIYDALLMHLKEISTPERAADSSHTFNQYTIRVKNGHRDALKTYLQEKGIPSRIYYPLSLHQQKAFEAFCPGIVLPVAEQLCNEVLSLPIHTEMKKEEAELVGKSIIAFFEKNP